MNSHNNESLERFSGDSFRDLTRIAKINENLWSELFILNKDILVNDIESFILCLNDLKDKIKDSKEEDIKELMRESTKRRKEFER
jgi:prephenate dehydrogenase